MKKCLSIAMLFCLLMTMLPMAVFADETESTEETAAAVISREPGYCGENLTWSFDSGTLTISGSGEMDDYEDQAPPWADQKHDIEKLVFTGGVTYVGAYAFTDYDQLEEVDFGGAMHTIGEQAFYSCDGLVSFDLPATFRCFGQECFMGCQKLAGIYCAGGMPSFKGSCVWDTRVTIYYPPNNPWPAEYVLPLVDAFQYKINIIPGTSPNQKTAAEEPRETQVSTVPETIPETVPETTVPTTEATEPTETTQASTEETQPTTQMTEPEWLRETYEVEEPAEKEVGRSLSMGLVVSLCIILGILCLILIGALVFRRRKY